MSPKTKQSIIISVIAVVMAVIITLVLIWALKPAPAPEKKLDNDDSQTTSTSSNLKFELVDEEEASYPQTATNWTKYGYSAPTSSTQGYKEITSSEDAVMGVVDVEDWTKVSSDLSFTANNPGKFGEGATDSNVYMIHNLHDYAASIYSKSYSLASKAYVKVTVWINTEQVSAGNAFIMLKSGLSSALEKNWYSYDFEIGQASGWQQKTLYLFNQSKSSATVYLNVGLGNVYNNTPATGTLFVDDIVYEKVTADVYRQHAKDVETTTHVIPASEKDEPLETKAFSAYESTMLSTMTAEAYLDEAKVSPFAEEINITKFTGTDTFDKMGAKIALGEIKKNATEDDIVYVSFWIRVDQQNAYSNANIYLVNDDNEIIGSSAFTKVVTSQEIDTDNLCGWQQYSYYIKPDEAPINATLLVTLGDKDGYNQLEKYPSSATIYVTDAEYDVIGETAYDDVSTGSYTKKVEIATVGAEFAITNGSFSEKITVGDHPASWTPVFAGDIEIFKNGTHGVEGLNTTAKAIAGSGIEADPTVAPSVDDENGKYLKINNAEQTAFGYISDKITLSANTVYVVSMLAKGDGTAMPSMYLICDGEVVASNTMKTGDSSDEIDAKFFQTTAGNGWQRYYFVIAVGDNAKSFTLALFNGAVDGSAKQQGAVYFDQVDYVSIGAYTRDEEDHTKLTFTADSEYPMFDELEEVATMKKLDFTEDYNEPEEQHEHEEETPEEEVEHNANWAFIVSFMSSMFLIAALLIVLVVKFFRRKH